MDVPPSQTAFLPCTIRMGSLWIISIALRGWGWKSSAVCSKRASEYASSLRRCEVDHGFDKLGDCAEAEAGVVASGVAVGTDEEDCEAKERDARVRTTWFARWAVLLSIVVDGGINELLRWTLSNKLACSRASSGSRCAIKIPHLDTLTIPSKRRFDKLTTLIENA